jgi:deferrochelatase/peroxidase EfeB
LSSADGAGGAEGRGRRPGALSRRQLFAGTGALGTGMVTASLLAGGAAPAAGDDAAGAGGTVPFTGPHQAGIVTPLQGHLVFAVYDATATGRFALATLLGTWTAAAARMAAGRALGGGTDADATPLASPPPDTGEALGLSASRLTVTVGFGPGLFDGRYGLSGLRPAALAELPAFPGDALDPVHRGGDLCLQACADDPQVAFHAVHNLTRLASGSAALRYYQVGFQAPAVGPAGTGTGADRATSRNLLGFHDGTANRTVETPEALERFVWVGDGTDQDWMRGGTYLVARRIRIYLEAWARASLSDQQATIGRFKASGAPLTGTAQYDSLDLHARAADGVPVIPTRAHVRQAAPATNGGAQLLRRSFNFADGVDPVTGELDAGLFFICFQRDPARQFTAIQRRLSAGDALTATYLVHTGSGVFACPPGVGPGESWGDCLGLSPAPSGGY